MHRNCLNREACWTPYCTLFILILFSTDKMQSVRTLSAEQTAETLAWLSWSIHQYFVVKGLCASTLLWHNTGWFIYLIIAQQDGMSMWSMAIVSQQPPGPLVFPAQAWRTAQRGPSSVPFTFSARLHFINPFPSPFTTSYQFLPLLHLLLSTEIFSFPLFFRLPPLLLFCGCKLGEWPLQV